MQKLACLLLALAAIGAAPAWAAPAAGKDKPSGKKDLVKEALALPPGTVLRSDQQAKYKEAKDFYEPKLREALEKLDKATASEKHKAYVNLKKLREEIDDAIAEILKMPGPTISKPKPVTTSTFTPRPVPRSTRPTTAHALRAPTPRASPAQRARAIRAPSAIRY